MRVTCAKVVLKCLNGILIIFLFLFFSTPTHPHSCFVAEHLFLFLIYFMIDVDVWMCLVPSSFSVIELYRCCTGVIRQWWCMNEPTPRNSPRAFTTWRTKILCLTSCVTACGTHSELQRSWKSSNAPSRPAWCIWLADDDDDVGLNVLGCRADILGTNCNKLWKLKTKLQYV